MAMAKSAVGWMDQGTRSHAQAEGGTWPWRCQQWDGWIKALDHARPESGTRPWRSQQWDGWIKGLDHTHKLRVGHGHGDVSSGMDGSRHWITRTS